MDANKVEKKFLLPALELVACCRFNQPISSLLSISLLDISFKALCVFD
jgi:hypothetical protein